MANLKPPPWELKGSGYIILYKIPKALTLKLGFIPQSLKGRFKGGVLSVIVVDYKQTDAGPYRELLYIPGVFYKEGARRSISKIYVSTTDSLINGRKNWGIPKELADFKFEKLNSRSEYIMVRKEGKPVAEFIFMEGRFCFPLKIRFLPFNLIQVYENKYYYNTFRGEGVAGSAKIRHIDINSSMFPQVSSLKPRMVIKIKSFSMIFQTPKTKNLG